MNKKLFVRLAVLAAIGVGVYFGVSWILADKQPDVKFKTAEVERRDVVFAIDATGTVEPEDLIDVGARVSGQIVTFGKDKNGNEVDYGSNVREGDVIALIDDALPSSNLLEAKAKLEEAKASFEQSKADLVVSRTDLRQAERDWARAKRLGVSEALSQSAYDTYLSTWEKSSAQIAVSEAKINQAAAAVEQCEAALKTAQRNLEYCVIRAPVDGVIIDRKVNVGQTVVSNMSASSLFLIAKDLKKMEVWASVNEADIGNIRAGQDVSFTVDAFAGEVFHGKVSNIRLNATMSQNVVTYVVEVKTDNSDNKLLPYLTANLSFIVRRADNALAVPNTALRWKPSDGQVADGVDVSQFESKRCVWVVENDRARPIPVKVTVNDGTASAVESPDLKDGMLVITGVESGVQADAAASNPFMPKFPSRKQSTNSAKTNDSPPPEK